MVVAVAVGAVVVVVVAAVVAAVGAIGAVVAMYATHRPERYAPFSRVGFGSVGCPASGGSQIHRYLRCFLHLRFPFAVAPNAVNLQHSLVYDDVVKAGSCGIERTQIQYPK